MQPAGKKYVPDFEILLHAGCHFETQNFKDHAAPPVDMQTPVDSENFKDHVAPPNYNEEDWEYISQVYPVVHKYVDNSSFISGYIHDEALRDKIGRLKPILHRMLAAVEPISNEDVAAASDSLIKLSYRVSTWDRKRFYAAETPSDRVKHGNEVVDIVNKRLPHAHGHPKISYQRGGAITSADHQSSPVIDHPPQIESNANKQSTAGTDQPPQPKSSSDKQSTAGTDKKSKFIIRKKWDALVQKMKWQAYIKKLPPFPPPPPTVWKDIVQTDFLQIVQVRFNAEHEITEERFRAFLEHEHKEEEEVKQRRALKQKKNVSHAHSEPNLLEQERKMAREKLGKDNMHSQSDSNLLGLKTDVAESSISQDSQGAISPKSSEIESPHSDSHDSETHPLLTTVLHVEKRSSGSKSEVENRALSSPISQDLREAAISPKSSNVESPHSDNHQDPDSETQPLLTEEHRH